MKKINWKNLKIKLNVWSLYYRQEIIWFIVGFVVGLVL